MTDKQRKNFIKRLDGYSDTVKKYYFEAIDKILKITERAELNEDGQFSFKESLSADKRREVDKILKQLYTKVYNEIKSNIRKEWNNANSLNDNLILQLFGKNVIENNHFARYFGRNMQALDSFTERRSGNGGLNLSERVWRYTGQLRDEIELALTFGIGEGDSAADIARKVKQYLLEPNKLFRRVRDAEGNLQLSKAAREYNPGRGIYRSSHKNAMRMTRTEINMAYRKSDSLRVQQFDFVLGIEIHLSNAHPEEDICDELMGKYPKDFVFVGWHPQCLCFTTTIVDDSDDWYDYMRRYLAGEDLPPYVPKGLITDVPDGFKEWVRNNAEKIEGYRERGTLPYFIRDNEKYVANVTFAGSKTAEMQQTKDTLKEYENGGKIEIYSSVNRNTNDFEKIYTCCDFFAKKGEKTVILPNPNRKNPLYNEAFKGIIGTKYDPKCPDFKVGKYYYEHEGYKTDNVVNAFCNMISNGIKQSNRLVIDDCGVGRVWAKRQIYNRVKNGDDILEVWILEKDKSLTRLF